MGNMHGTVYRNGQQIDVGYGVPTTCEQPGCEEEIDRGLAYLCGDVHGGDENSCGGYFCGQHLYMPPEGHHGNRCILCRDRGTDAEVESPDATVVTFG
ncbi:hypothetical protein [Streptomyces griseosporeus]